MLHAHRATLLAAALMATACGRQPSVSAAVPQRPPAPGLARSGQGRPALPPMRVAEPTLPPPSFPDPGRRDKLVAALPEVARYLAEEVKKMELPGAAVGVVIDGELVHAEGFGFRDAEAKAPVDADSVFRIASMTKSFTAMAILRLRDEGRLGLDDPAAQHVPELAGLAYPTRDAAPITIRQLLSHSAGFPEDNPWGDRQLGMPEEEFTAFLRKGAPFSNAPGVQFEYSNLGFAILGRVVSRVSGVPYRDYVTEQVLRPLGMAATVFDEREVPRERLARGYRREDGALKPVANLPDGAFGAMGGLYSSVRDMARYAAFHLAAWPPRDDPEARPLRRSSAREMQQSARYVALTVRQGTEDEPPGATAAGYGFGLSASETCPIDRIVAHSGGLPGYGSNLYMLPEHGVAVVALANLTYAAAGRLTRGVVSVLSASGGLVKRAPTPAPALAAAQEAALRLLARWDDAVADTSFAASFFLDVPRAKLVAQLEALRKTHGACRPDGRIDAENALRGGWKLSCERGWIDAGLTLAPTLPPRIQALTLEGSLPPSDRLSEAATRIAALTGRWDDAAAARLFDGKLDRAWARKLFADTATARGACKVDRAVGGDGARRAKVRLACERYPVVVDLSINERSGKVTSVRFDPVAAPAGKCAH